MTDILDPGIAQAQIAKTNRFETATSFGGQENPAVGSYLTVRDGNSAYLPNRRLIGLTAQPSLGALSQFDLDGAVENIARVRVDQ